jgi:hypothetical protein
VPALLDVLREAGAGLAARLVTRLASPGTVRALLVREKPDFAAVSELLPLLDAEALDPLLDVLTESDDRQQRRAAFDLLRRAGDIALPPAMERLSDPRWYVARNLLALLAQAERIPPAFDPTPWLLHDDGRVRREALRGAVRLAALRNAALVAALADPDPSVLGIALVAAQERCPHEAVSALLDVAGRDGLDEALRARAMAALGRAPRDERVLELLLNEAPREGRRLPWQSAPHTTAMMLAALSALAAGWSDDPRAMPLLRRARASADPDVRRAAGGLV